MKFLKFMLIFVVFFSVVSLSYGAERVVRRTYYSESPYYEEVIITEPYYQPTTIINRPGEINRVVVYPSRRIIINPNRGYIYNTGTYSTSTISEETVEIIE